jgi:hypothetical protein
MKLAPRFAALALVVTLGCSKPPAEAHPEPAAPTETPATEPPAASTPAAPRAAAAAEPGAPADFPPECVAYAALIEKLKACDKVGEGREGLTRGYEELRSTWAMVGVDQRAAFDVQCKTQADSLRDAAAATCGW